MDRKKQLRVIVVGGGASGMMAALAAAEQGASVLLLERQARLGRKLAATGNGRCNITNLYAAPEHYHGEDVAFCTSALLQETYEKSLSRFRDMGLLTVTEEDGRVYPMSDSAGSVVDVLRFSLEAAGVEVLCGCTAEQLVKQKKGYQIAAGERTLSADRVIVACGGKAGGKLGGVSDGYRLLSACGHQCTALRPALVQLRTEGTAARALKGVRTQALVSVYHDGELVRQTRGEVQFTEYGLSGPAIFEVSREALMKGESVVTLDLFPDMGAEALMELLRRRILTRPNLKLEDLFTGTIQNRLGRVLISSAGLSCALPLPEAEPWLRKLAERAKAFSFRVIGDLGFDQAQVTAGGVQTSEFDPRTMESRLSPGLYACGEVLDIDGDCGGYNLQWAWSSGWIAGTHAGKGGMAC